MELIHDVGQVPSRGAGNLVAMGKWDGVHLAHQAIIKNLVAEARRTGSQAVVMGFHPLPMAVLRPSEAPLMLQTLRERAEVLASLGVDVHLALPFTESLSKMAPEEFVREVLVGSLAARQVFVGFNHTFGRGGKGTAGTLQQLCMPHGVPVRIFEPIRTDGENVSSTEVRFYVSTGQMEHAAQLLGRPFSLTGTVVKGDQRGRTIGFPTANLDLAPRRQLPATGVYVAKVTVLEQPACTEVPCEIVPRTGPNYGAMLNLGRRPTVGGLDLRCEVHLLDFEGDLYGKELRVEFLHRLRGEQAFAGLHELKGQLAADEAAARVFLKGYDAANR